MAGIAPPGSFSSSNSQGFSAGQARTYTWNFTVPSSWPAGTYRVAAGIFAANWSSNLLWVSPKAVLCGVGRRTNQSGQRQVAKLLETLDVECRPVPVPKEVQHLLGCMQVVSPERALVRTEIASDRLLRELARLGLEIVSVSETEEVAEHWALNFVVLEPDRVIVSGEVPVFRRFLASVGIQIADAVPISQYGNAAGGLACATAILARDLV